eukprot:1147312-Pelagomonas_calceolata.AAC.4
MATRLATDHLADICPIFILRALGSLRNELKLHCHPPGNAAAGGGAGGCAEHSTMALRELRQARVQPGHGSYLVAVREALHLTQGFLHARTHMHANMELVQHRQMRHILSAGGIGGTGSCQECSI